MGIICCCLRTKVEEDSQTTHILDQNYQQKEVRSESFTTTSPKNISPSLYRTPSVGLTEQSLFDETVQEMASKIINISALSDQLPQTVWFERQKLYAKKISSLKNPLPLRFEAQKLEPKKKSDHNRCLSLEPIPDEDVALINHLSDKSSKAVRNGFNYHSDEPFVVEFNPYNQ